MKLHNHPDYDKLAAEWQLHDDLYMGDHATLTKSHYLWYHELEATQQVGAKIIRDIRERRTRYVNFYRPILSRYTSLLFKEDLEVPEEVRDMFGDEINDVDGNGNPLDVFVKEIANAYFLYGWPVVVVDAMAAGPNNRPFFELVNPLGVKDWEIRPSAAQDENGIQFMRAEYQELSARESSSDEPQMLYRSKEYRMSDTGYEIALYTAESDAADGKDWRLDEVIPMDQNYVTISTIQQQESYFHAVAPQALLCHNTQSALDNALLYQAYQRIIVSGDLSADERLALTEYTMTFVPEGSTVNIIEPAVFTSLERRYDVAVQNLLRTAFNQTRVTSAESRQVESADNQREQKEDLLAKLRTAAKEIEAVINRAISYYADYKGIEGFDAEVNINDDITIEDLNESLTMYQAYADRITRYPTWQREVDIKMAQRMGLNKTDDIVNEIESTKAVSLDDRRAAIAQAFVSGNGG